jgi:hypothetical protein
VYLSEGFSDFAVHPIVRSFRQPAVTVRGAGELPLRKGRPESRKRRFHVLSGTLFALSAARRHRNI